MTPNINNQTLSSLFQGFIDQIAIYWKYRPEQDAELSNAMILSLSDGQERAKTVTFNIDSNQSENDWQNSLIANVEKQLKTIQRKFSKPLCYLRLEWIIDQNNTNWKEFSGSLKQYKRNYFRSGFAFVGKKEPSFLLCTEAELNANACLYGNDEDEATVNDKNLNKYLQARHGSSQVPQFTDETPIIVFKTDGIFINAFTEKIHKLNIMPRNQGRRVTPQLNPDSTLELIDLASHYLSKQIQQDGQYRYGYFPVFGREIPTYNTLRHASSTYALLEGYEACRDELNSNYNNTISPNKATEKSLQEIHSQIDKAINYLLTRNIKYSQDCGYVVDSVSNEIKLGANATTILALVKYLSVFPQTQHYQKYLDTANKLANGIISMQEENGSFIHILDGNNFSFKEKTRTIYYDGEAAFALMRLYGVTREQKILDCVVKAFDFFIANHHENAHDHWLSYCSNELLKYLPEKKYFAFAVNNVNGFVDFIRDRLTTYPTLLELSMAFHNALLLLDKYPQFQDVLDGFNVAEFYRALHTRANYLVNGFFFPEKAMFYKYPNTILHGFYIQHHAFRVRIDDVEHYLSGLVAYRKLLKSNKYPQVINRVTQNILTSVLNAENLKIATKGKWIKKPDNNWFANGLCATGLCIHPDGFLPGKILVARNSKNNAGFLPKVAIKSLINKGASAVITDDIEHYQEINIPILQVNNVRQATLNIGSMVRQHYQGKVIGVTGSVGKTTTVAMLAHVLSQNNKNIIGASQGSANIPIGIAWNMSSMPQNAKYWVVEMAIGGMATNTAMVQPDIVIISNIAPSHMEFHHTVENIALKKSRIFEKMCINGTAVICRDIEQFDIIKQQANLHNIKIISYGEHIDADVKLINYKNHNAEILLNGQIISLTMQASGKHMIINAMAVLTVASILGENINDITPFINNFQPVDGRGKIYNTTFNSKNITIIDEAYNANPLSMRAAIESFADSDISPQHRVLILGDMLELGENSDQYHLEIADYLSIAKANRIILCGTNMQKLSEKISNDYQTIWFNNVNDVITNIGELIKDKDSILIKSSNGTGLWELVNYLKGIK
ncbi:MAG: hypothetical protein IK065_02880 [Neisseriaceae bacterium]|nr:hypothetical protein [Neisseriaceae bacterium]